MKGGPQDATVVHDCVVHRLRRLLALRLVHVSNFLADRVVVADPGEGHRVIALGCFPAASADDVVFTRGPYQSNDLGQRIALALEFLDRHPGPGAEQMVDDEVGPVTLGDVEHLRAHLDAGGRHRKGSEFEPLGLLQILYDRDRLATGRVVVEDVGDLLPLEVAAQFVLDELDRRGALGKIGRSDREQIRKALAVGRGGNTETRRGAGDLVLGELLVQRLNLRRTVDQDRGRAVPLLALIRLDRRRYLVLVVDFFVFDLIALDPALRIDQVEIVLDPRANPGAVDLGRPGAIAHAADDYLLLLGPGTADKTEPCGRADNDGQHRDW